MKTLKASQEFVVGKNNIAWIGSGFKEHLYDLTFTKKSSDGLITKKLPRTMSNKEILEEMGPEPIDLGDVLAFLEKADHTGWYLCYVKDTRGVLWAVLGYWYGDGWYFEADPLGYPDGWGPGHRVLSRRFFVPQKETLSEQSGDTLELRVAKIEQWIEGVRSQLL